MAGDERKLVMVLPDPKVFRLFLEMGKVANPAMQSASLENGVPQFDHAEYPKEGGILRFYKDFKYPEKGLAFPQVIYAVNIVKRIFVGWLRFLSKHPFLALFFASKRVLNDFIEAYSSIADLFLQQFYFKDEFYQPFAWQIISFTGAFLAELGVNPRSMPLFFGTMMEHDNAYRYVVQDISLETTKEKLLENLPRELNRLIPILKSRSHDTFRGKEGMYDVSKWESGAKIMKWMWKRPKYRKALRAGLNAIEWDKFLPDEADKHHMLFRSDYKYGGVPMEERWKTIMEIYYNDPPKLIYQKR